MVNHQWTQQNESFEDKAKRLLREKRMRRDNTKKE